MKDRPKSSKPEVNQELDKVERQFEAQEQNIKEMTLDRLREAPKQDVEPQTKIAQRDMAKANEIYLKPEKTISSPDKFNENYRSKYDFAREYVPFIAEHREIIGETIEIWTKPFAGVPAMFWKVPTNKRVFGPRYLAEQIKKCNYRRLIMRDDKFTTQDGMGQYYGALTVDTTVQRLDANPAIEQKSVFMGSSNF